MAEQRKARFSFTSPAQLDVLRFTGIEGISRLYQFELDLVSASPGIALGSMIRKPVTLSIVGREADRHVHGIVARFEVLGARRNHTLYRAHLVPPQHCLTLRRRLRIFQRMTTEQIVSQVLREAGITRQRWRLRGRYTPRDYCVQFRESDHDFVSRLLEEEGIAYHFDHAAGSVTTVFTDRSSAFEEIEGGSRLDYAEGSGKDADAEAITHLRVGQQLRSGKVTLRDHDFKRPGADLEARRSGEETSLEHYDFPGEYVSAGLGRRLARARLQELETDREPATAASPSNRLVPGRTFTIGGWFTGRHARGSANQGYLVVAAAHHGSQPQALEEEAAAEGVDYGVEVELVPDDTDYRPPRVTPRPRALGVHTATVVGPAAEEIYTDEHGRVKVHFHWDRDSAGDQHASCWIRPSQAWAGAGYGAITLPRVGQEVLVSFLEGDPDRPVITGRVYNGAQQVPYALPAGQTRSTLRSSSSPGGGGSNELRMEDSAYSEELYIHAQRDYNVVVERDRSTIIDRDRTTTITGDQTRTVGRDRGLEVTESSTHTARTILLEASEKLTATVGGSTLELTPGELALSSAQLSISGSTSVTITGKLVRINAGAAAPAKKSWWGRLWDWFDDNVLGLFRSDPPPPPPPPPPLTVHDTNVPFHVDADTGTPTATHYASTGSDLFRDGASPGDVQQGSAGDCYFLASMAALAHTRPELVEGMVQENDDGTYRVDFEGGDNSVLVTDQMPHQQHTYTDSAGNVQTYDTLAYGRSTDADETWVGVTEKAYAASYGGGQGYEGVGHGDWPSVALDRTTGGQTTTHNIAGANEALWSDLQAAQDSRHPMVASSVGTPAAGSPVVGNHAYTVMGVSEDAAGDRQVHLRNPWGGSGQNTSGQERGEFTMSYDDFARDYHRVDINDPDASP